MRTPRPPFLDNKWYELWDRFVIHNEKLHKAAFPVVLNRDILGTLRALTEISDQASKLVLCEQELRKYHELLTEAYEFLQDHDTQEGIDLAGKIQAILSNPLMITALPSTSPLAPSDVTFLTYVGVVTKYVNSTYGVRVLEFGQDILSTGDTIHEAIANAHEELQLHVEGMMDEGEPLPPSANFDDVFNHLQYDEVGFLLRVSVPGTAVINHE